MTHLQACPMKAIELSRLTGVSVHTIRYYERLGLLKARRNRRNGYHEFTDEHIRRLAFIRRARGMGLTLAEVRAVMGCAGARSRCPEVLEILRRALPMVERELHELGAVRDRMRKSLRSWHRLPGGLPRGEDVRRLVESLAGKPGKTAVGAPYREGIS